MIDVPNRTVLAIEVDLSLPATRVVRVMEHLEEMEGLPKAIRLDNCSELLSAIFANWREAKRIELKFIQSGKPQQNAFIERFNGTYRHQVLMPTSLNRYSRFAKLLRNGSTATTKIAHMQNSGIGH